MAVLSVQDLQAAYELTSAEPELTRTTARGALTLRDQNPASNAALQEWQNTAGTSLLRAQAGFAGATSDVALQFGPSSQASIRWRNTDGDLALDAGTAPNVVRIDSRCTLAGSERAFEIRDNGGTARLAIETVPNTSDLRIKWPTNPELTEIGFPASDPSYFAFLNTASEFWLGIAADPTLYFNFFAGDNMEIGVAGNGQVCNFHLNCTGAVNTNGLLMDHDGGAATLSGRFKAPNTASNPFTVNLGSSTTGFSIPQNNKYLGVGTSHNGRISWDGTDLLIDPDAVTATGQVRIGGDLRIDLDLRHVGTLAGFYNATPVVRPTIATLTGTAGGTADNALVAVPDPADAPATADALRDDLVANVLPVIRDDVDDVRAKLLEIRTALVNVGLIA